MSPARYILAPYLFALGLAAGPADTLLATGLRLDPAGDAIDVGSMPLAMVLTPEKNRVIIVLSGWREQGIQVVDLKSRTVIQALHQDSAFYGIAFSPGGREFYVSGGNDDSIWCYSWDGGAAALRRKIVLGKPKADQTGSRYPAGLAVSKDGRFLYIAENVGDSLAVVDLATESVVQRLPTDHYPYAVAPGALGELYVSAWGANTVSVFRAGAGGALTYQRKITVGRHPSALAVNKTGSRLYAAISGADQIAVVDTHSNRVLYRFHDPAPHGPSQGSTPNALALSRDGSHLLAAEADNNAIAVFQVTPQGVWREAPRPLGRIPTDWYPTGVIDTDNGLLVLTGKGRGSHANPDGPTPGERIKRPTGYALGQLGGTIRILPQDVTGLQLKSLTKRVAAANGWEMPAPKRHYPPFKHVIYVIKENRTYDQVFGDIPEGDGDPGLVFFGNEISPNHHALALRFGLFDRFFTNAEVSSQGHIWSTAGYVTEYGEKTVPSAYSDRRASPDGEEANEPGNGFLWTLAAKKGITFRDYGEMIAVPDGWPVTQRELAANISPSYPAFDLRVPDQVRADAWIAELHRFEKDANLPQLEILHLPGDHTAGGRAGYPTPRAYMADNDLALGRMVEALSRSAYWRDTVMFVVEDDSQAGPDHVDAHRSPALVISAFSRKGTWHRFANTTDIVAAIEDILGLDRLSKFDYFSRSLSDVFSDAADLTPYSAIVPKIDLKETNPPHTETADLSEGLDFSAPDKVNDAVFNAILWKMLKGTTSLPGLRARAPLHTYQVSR